MLSGGNKKEYAMLTLDYHPPCDWAWMLDFLGARAVAGIETVSATAYRRSLAISGCCGILAVRPHPAANRVAITLSDGLLPVQAAVLARVTALFDLALEPTVMLSHLGTLAAARPGLRLPGCMDPFEQAVRAVLGQLVSVAMAAKLTAKVVQAWGDPLPGYPGWRLFPRPEQLAILAPEQLNALGMPLRRAQAIIHIARLCLEGEFPLTPPADVAQGIKELMTLPGIGRWTASYYALRGWQAADIFLPDDYAVKQRFAGMTVSQTRRYSVRWQPWRSYALLHVWNSESWRPG
jgi:DNA-3-methyladenine glycosylase II